MFWSIIQNRDCPGYNYRDLLCKVIKIKVWSIAILLFHKPLGPISHLGKVLLPRVVIPPVPVVVVAQTTGKLLEPVQCQAKPSLFSIVNVQEAVATGNLTNNRQVKPSLKPSLTAGGMVTLLLLLFIEGL